MIRPTTTTAIAVALALVAASPASAAVRSGSASFNPNSSAPTFNPLPLLPPVNISVSYDDAGTLSVTESGGNVPADITNAEADASNGESPWAFNNWEFAGLTVSNSTGVELSVGQSGPGLIDSQVAGTLAGQVAPGSDGSSLTATWSNPMLANLNLTYVQIDGLTAFGCVAAGCYSYDGGAFYFSGYAPTVSVTSPGTQVAQVGFSADPVTISAQIVGASSDDSTAAISTLSAAGLPPGLTLDNSGDIQGTPTQPGNYTTTITATGKYNGGTQAATGSTTFNWQINRPRVTLPAYLGAGAPSAGQGLETRPASITYTGDGTGFFAGYGAAGHRPHVGRLHWSSWTTAQALATGGDWGDNCTPDCASGFRTAYRVRLRAYLPRVIDGYSVFTRLAVTYTGRRPRGARRAYTWSLSYNDGFFWS